MFGSSSKGNSLLQKMELEVTTWATGKESTFHFLPWIFGVFSVCKAQRNRAPPQDLNPRMLSTGPQLFTGEYSRIHVQGSSKRTGPPIVSLDLIWSVQLSSLQARANHHYPPYVHLHMLGFLLLFWVCFLNW